MWSATFSRLGRFVAGTATRVYTVVNVFNQVRKQELEEYNAEPVPLVLTTIGVLCVTYSNTTAAVSWMVWYRLLRKAMRQFKRNN